MPGVGVDFGKRDHVGVCPFRTRFVDGRIVSDRLCPERGSPWKLPADSIAQIVGAENLHTCFGPEADTQFVAHGVARTEDEDFIAPDARIEVRSFWQIEILALGLVVAEQSAYGLVRNVALPRITPNLAVFNLLEVRERPEA